MSFMDGYFTDSLYFGFFTWEISGLISLSLFKQSQLKIAVKSPQGSSPITLFAIIFSVMISVQLFARETAHFDKSGIDNPVFNYQKNFGDWQYSSNLELGWEPQIVGASIAKTQSYVFGNDIVQISLGYYPWQSQGSEAVSWQNRVVGSGRKKWIDIRENQI